MNKPKRIFYIAGFALLVLLFLASVTDLFFQEQDARVYAVSVIIDDTSDDFWINFKKGMDQAAADYNVDISFVTLYDNSNEQNFQQTELIRREIEDGAQALVLCAADSMKMAQSLSDMEPEVPVIAVQHAIPYQGVSSSILPDNQEMGRLLAEQIGREEDRGKKVYAIAPQMVQDSLRERYQKLEEALTAEGFQVILITGQEPGTAEALVRQATENRESCVMVGLDAAVLLDVADWVEEYYGNYLISVYGFGHNARILDMMEHEKIDGIGVTDDYVMGYLSIQNAVASLNREETPGVCRLNGYLATGDRMYEEELSRILFPIP